MREGNKKRRKAGLLTRGDFFVLFFPNRKIALRTDALGDTKLFSLRITKQAVLFGHVLSQI
jgi:hypothetical protein